MVDDVNGATEEPQSQIFEEVNAMFREYSKDESQTFSQFMQSRKRAKQSSPHESRSSSPLAMPPWSQLRRTPRTVMFPRRATCAVSHSPRRASDDSHSSGQQHTRSSVEGHQPDSEPAEQVVSLAAATGPPREEHLSTALRNNPRSPLTSPAHSPSHKKLLRFAGDSQPRDEYGHYYHLQPGMLESTNGGLMRTYEMDDEFQEAQDSARCHESDMHGSDLGVAGHLFTSMGADAPHDTSRDSGPYASQSADYGWSQSMSYNGPRGGSPRLGSPGPSMLRYTLRRLFSDVDDEYDTQTTTHVDYFIINSYHIDNLLTAPDNVWQQSGLSTEEAINIKRAYRFYAKGYYNRYDECRRDENSI